MSRTRTGSISPEQIIAAYCQGYFPMASGPDGEIDFYYYEPRGIIPLDDRFTVRKSLRQVMRREKFEVTIDRDFSGVIRSCARHNLPKYEVWLSHGMISIYEELHRMGIAHSVEVWTKDEVPALVGGLYGLVLGGAFFGESMFSSKPYTSQIALVKLVEHLRSRDFSLLDAQMSSDHLKQFGQFECSQDEYLEFLYEALLKERTF
jgi:leucyl/phenylalanyl-tRNA---protein transferase